MKICSKCEIKKDLSDFKRYLICKDCYSKQSKLYNDSRKEKMKEYYIINRDKIIESSKDNYIKNREYNIERNKNYQHINKDKRNKYLLDRKKNDNLFKITISIRNLIYVSIKNRGYSKKSKVNTILGCSFEDFKIYIESQFKNEMNWDNYGQWHLDHKVPISWAETEEKIYELNHYKNFQPLWAKDNLIKGNKWAD